MKKAFFVSAALAIAGLSGAAGAETYDCRFAPGDSDNGWIMPRVVITHDPATGKAQVLDNIVAFHNDGQPMAAKFKAGSNGVMKFSWRVTNVSTSTPAKTSVSYNLRLNPGNMIAQYSARVQGGGTQKPYARGRCTRS